MNESQQGTGKEAPYLTCRIQFWQKHLDKYLEGKSAFIFHFDAINYTLKIHEKVFESSLSNVKQ